MSEPTTTPTPGPDQCWECPIRDGRLVCDPAVSRRCPRARHDHRGAPTVSYSETWQAARERRRARRAADPKVQARALQRALEADREAAQQETKLRRGAA